MQLGFTLLGVVAGCAVEDMVLAEADSEQPVQTASLLALSAYLVWVQIGAAVVAAPAVLHWLAWAVAQHLMSAVVEAPA